MLNWLERIVLVAVYPIVIGARLVSAITRRDRLHLREPGGSCWIERPPMPPAASYFHDGPHAERLPAAQRLLIAWSRLRHDRTPSDSRAADGDIPDEIYTLW